MWFKRKNIVMKTCGVLIVLGGVMVLLMIVAPRGTSQHEPLLLYRMLRSLDLVLQFLLDHPHDLVGDTLFGVTLSQGQLTVLLGHIADSGGRELITKLQQLRAKCQLLLDLANPLVRIRDNAAYTFIVKRLINPELWLVDRPHVFDTLRSTQSYIDRSGLPSLKTGPLSVDNYLGLLHHGQPNATTSDACLFGLLTPHLAADNRTLLEQCYVSHECWLLETGGSMPSGYPLTHRLLFFQVARQAGCELGPFTTGLNQRVQELCSEILFEAETLDRLEFPRLVEDLFVEQVTLCGMEGFMEFTRPDWLERIVSWQRPQGCYGDTEADGKELGRALSLDRRVKRDDGAMEFNCTMHVTGLAAAALAVGVKSLVEVSLQIQS